MSLSFAHPWALLLLFAPAWLLVRIWRQHGPRVALPFDHGQGSSGKRWRAALDLGESLAPVLLGIVVVILAGPQRLGEPKTERMLTNIEFCVDVSGSMISPFGEGTRYDASMKAIDEFLANRSGDAFGLTFFANNVLRWVPLTSDPSALRCAPPFMKPENGVPWMQGTLVGKALRECRKTLAEREEGDRMIVLVTDGVSADLNNGNDAAIAEELKKDGITVFIIHVAEGDAPPQMAVIASMTGGEVFSVGDPAGLESVFRRIDAMKQAKLKKTVAETLDDFGPYALAGLATLGLMAATSLFGLRYTPW
ncbi:vWA domain-containing protein [Tundrisphaera sp. TA3]|uniref:vWA domain-containing protein n=1 Tax=Tundrisphaera sp. TA3 TaxID=3435775 RepID=UPI003EB6A0FE